MLLILIKLELNPFTLGVALAVEPDQVLGGLLLLVVSVEPSRGLGEPEGTEGDDGGEHQLETEGDHPGSFTRMVKAASRRTASNEGSDGPHDVVETGDDTTVGRVRDFDDVDRAGGGGDSNTETKEETASHELVDASGVVAGELDDDTDDDDRGTNCHAGTSAPGIDGGTNKGDSYDGTNLVHGGDDT
jgi:hypothetical protein